MNKPDWDTWQLMPLWELWQAVALSMNIEPASLPTPALRSSGQDWFEECPDEFKRRRQIAITHLMGKTLPYFEWRNNESYIVLRAAEFAKWAVALPLARPGKQLPPQLIALSQESDIPEVAAEPNVGWPWGSHETELLKHLAAAAARWWTNFDPADNTTAPTNEQVSEWLQERKVSQRMADTMATILRADNIPPGPRT